jgi:hypothetical protein
MELVLYIHNIKLNSLLKRILKEMVTNVDWIHLAQDTGPVVNSYVCIIKLNYNHEHWSKEYSVGNMGKEFENLSLWTYEIPVSIVNTCFR